MSDGEMWAGIVGFVLPLGIAMIQKQTWSAMEKAIVAFVCVAVGATGTAYFTGELTPHNIVRDFLIVFTLTITTFYGFWKPTGIAPSIEKNILG